jgi:hypothetical protein
MGRWRVAVSVLGVSVRVPTGEDQAPRPVRLSPQILAAIEVQEPQYPPLSRPETKQAAAWRSFHTALLSDADATWDGDAV